MPTAFDWLHGLLAGAAVLCAVLWLKARGGDPAQEAALAALRKELQDLKDRPLEQEYRIERFELVWHPVLTYSPKEKKVLKAVVGKPSCPKCAVPIQAGAGQDWTCGRCGKTFPASVLDLTVMDSVEKLARGYFGERHPDYGA